METEPQKVLLETLTGPSIIVDLRAKYGGKAKGAGPGGPGGEALPHCISEVVLKHF